MKKTIALVIAAVLAALALSGCKLDLASDAHKKITITGIDGKYEGLSAKLTLFKFEIKDITTPNAEGSAGISGGRATFTLYTNDGEPFTEGGILEPYQATLTIFGGSGTTAGAYGGTAGPVFIDKETTTISFSDFKGEGGAI